MLRTNLTKKDLINSIYMQIGFSKKISDNLIDDFFQTLIENLINEKKIKLSKFGTFLIREKKSRVGRNPKTKEEKIISSRNVVLFKASKEFKELVNSKNEE
jgi:integration host factor subunit alpha